MVAAAQQLASFCNQHHFLRRVGYSTFACSDFLRERKDPFFLRRE
jgi:hypothetical protein